ncbi:MAG: hypothetical protein HQ567_06635 [Candidatus Nealsonbacteria bacterium]|nr:hypothetical protein [Candidatus Nealsonbacteria bacterium]
MMSIGTTRKRKPQTSEPRSVDAFPDVRECQAIVDRLRSARAEIIERLNSPDPTGPGSDAGDLQGAAEIAERLLRGEAVETRMLPSRNVLARQRTSLNSAIASAESNLRGARAAASKTLLAGRSAEIEALHTRYVEKLSQLLTVIGDESRLRRELTAAGISYNTLPCLRDNDHSTGLLPRLRTLNLQKFKRDYRQPRGLGLIGRILKRGNK